MKKIKSALISVSDKSNLEPLLKVLNKNKDPHVLQVLTPSQINNVIQGKLIEIEIDSINENDAQKIVDDASKQLLANLVIEDYEITIIKDE